MMRCWSLMLLILILCGSAVAQDIEPTQGVFFLARDDTDQDGQVTDADNMRLYEVGLDGTVLFVTPPDLHIFDYAPAQQPDYLAVVIAQTPDNAIKTLLYKANGDLAFDAMSPNTSFIPWLEWRGDEIAWENNYGSVVRTVATLETYNVITGARASSPLEEGDRPTPFPSQTLILDNESFLLQETLTDNLLIVQYVGSEPADALWIYEKAEDRLTPFSAWLYTEPLLLATHPQGPRIALLGREFDGSMSLYTIDLSTGVAMPQVTQVLSGLIDPPYTNMQWTSDGAALLLVGESGDFVVSNIGRIEALYALALETGAFTRLSPEGTLVERASISSR